MNRRDFIALLGSAAAAMCPPLAACAEGVPPLVVGFLHPGSAATSAGAAAEFRKGLAEIGYVEGRNVVIEYRWGENQPDRLPKLAADLVGQRVSVIVTLASTPAAVAAMTATRRIPIVFSTGSDPVRAGLVASFNRPGGNVTGISSMNTELGGKRIGLLRELLPHAARFAILVNPSTPIAAQVADAQAAVAAIGAQIEIVHASAYRDIETAFETLAQKRVDALVVSPGAPFNERRAQIAMLAARRAIPTVFPTREWIDAGGLMSYGPIIADEFRNAGIYAGRILKGEKPAEMPVLRPTRFELGVNLQTARALGIIVPSSLLAQADEVIE
ncbi:MAG TPA: ABC transporter substrate-binding protein [Burkholderiales bacterium]|nr:ABC transporter substrate-binding protein [Burkholderiales bacterium]